jgi:glucose/arabinose dehydrogenase
MRRSLLLVLVAACGGGNDGPPPVDARDPTDAAVATCTPKSGTAIDFETIATGLDQPLLATSPPGDPRLFVIEQTGKVRVIKNGQLLETPFIDLGSAIQCCGEQGLLGIAFHPDFGQNDRFYVHHTVKNTGEHAIVEYKQVFGTDTADPDSRREILRFSDPYGNHNAGALEFGPDGMLYIAFGDGGAGGDPEDRAQNLSQLFGKILRIDVDARTGTKEYGIPADNPYAASPDGPTDPRPEVWQYGLRNPFRFTFDRATGNIYIGDVGQETWEEIDVSPNMPNVNYGWDDREGQHCYEPTANCLVADRLEPVVEFNHSDGWASIMGGAVYRGSCFSDLVGTYFYGDHYAGRLWAFEYSNGQAMNNRRVSDTDLAGMTSVHPDALGELYVTTINGTVRRIIVP